MLGRVSTQKTRILLDQIKKLLDKCEKIVSKYSIQKYTGSVAIIFNFSQGGIGTVKVEIERKVKDVNGNGYIRIISEELLK